jgi:NDP-4-keto-2,6-dideoxyhexose 3-C-methyltransferase
MTMHLAELAEDVLGRVRLEDGDVVVDIGSNDSTLLRQFPRSCVRVGVDPNGPQFREFYDDQGGGGGAHLVSEYFSNDAVARFGRAKVVCSVAMFYDLPDPKRFVRDVAQVLDPEGLWVLEQSYLPTMIEANSFDTVCHEHLEYYCLRQIDRLCRGAGLKIVDVAFNASNGGSFRVFVAHAGAREHKACDEKVERVLDGEARFAGLDVFRDFEARVRSVRDDLRFVLGAAVRDDGGGGGVYLYGASTKGNTLLQYIGAEDFGIAGASERNAAKLGCVTPGTRIPIVSEEAAREARPGFMLALPWHFKDEFLERERAYLEGGGRFVFPLPEVAIVGSRKTALITGVRGQLGRHLVRHLMAIGGYHVYGITRAKVNGVGGGETELEDVCMFEGSICNMDFISRVLRIVKPTEVYHLAAMTDRVTANERVHQTILDNGASVALLCEVLEREAPGAKLFVANSVGLFEGASEGAILDEACIDFYPTTPYSIAKVTAYWTARYFRDHRDLFVCTGLISNAESSLRRDSCVTKKIVGHDFGGAALVLDNVDACADWIHAADAARAMHAILQCSGATDYVVSSGKTHAVRDFVAEVLCRRRIADVVWEEGGRCVEPKTGRVLVKSRGVVRPYDRRVTFKNDTLLNVGWKVKYGLPDIIEEMAASGGESAEDS